MSDDWDKAIINKNLEHNMSNPLAITPTSFKTSSTVASTSHTSQPPAHASPPASIFWSPFFQSTHCYFLRDPSQSTIRGRQGSDPCTMISLLLTKTYRNRRVLFQQHHIQSMDQSWVVAFISWWRVGNHAYDTHVFIPTYWYVGVEEINYH